MSQSARILELLADGEWHTTRAILREVPSIVHSRVSDLRKQGHAIEHETIGSGAAGSRYRLVQVDAGPTRGVNGTGSPSGRVLIEPSLPGPATVDVASVSNVPGSQPPSPPAAGDQLTLETAAYIEHLHKLLRSEAVA